MGNIIEKVAKIKAHMLSAKQFGSEEEAQTFAAMMQRLMIDHDLNEADVDRAMNRTAAPEPIVELLVDRDSFGIEKKSRRVAWMEDLARVVARAYQCKWLLSAGSNRIWMVGTKRHAEIATQMFGSLAASLQKISIRETVRYKNRMKKEGDRSRGNGFKAAFEQGFITRLAERIEKEREVTIEEVVATSESGMTKTDALMVVNQTMTRVQAYLDEKFASRGGRGAAPIYGQNRYGAGTNAGRARGMAVADSISLRSPNRALKP